MKIAIVTGASSGMGREIVRQIGDRFGRIDEIWVVGTIITAGMAFELNVAKKYCIPVRLYDEDLREIDPETISLDKCITADYRKVMYGLKFA